MSANVPPSAEALEASLRQAGATHVVRNFDELRSSLDRQFATRRLYAGKTVKTRPMKPITMVVWHLLWLLFFFLLVRLFGWPLDVVVVLHS